MVWIEASIAGVPAPADARMRAKTRGAMASKSTARGLRTRMATIVLTDEKDESSSTERNFWRLAETDGVDLAFLKSIEAAGDSLARPDVAADTPEAPADEERDSSSVARPRAKAARCMPAAALHGSNTQPVPQTLATAGGRTRSTRAQSNRRSRTSPSVPPRAHLAGPHEGIR